MRISSIETALLCAAVASTQWIGRAAAAEAPVTNTSNLPAASPALEELVVTATRKSELLSRVPLSISAFSQEKLDTLGVKTIADVANLTPGVTFTSRKAIAIRGVVSNAGAGTTGIYVDDTPIQIYTVGSFATDSVPAIFDLDRIEVLRGPQGTLFGSGSMGGTVRYITPQPSLSDYSFHARAESSYSDQVGSSYEGGLAMGGPIVADVLGFRASAFYRRDGGWIDRVNRNSGAIVDEESNWGESYALRLATTWAPREGIEITPAIYHQYRYQNAGQGFPINTGDGGSASWQSFSNPDAGIFRSGSRIETPGRDRSTLSSVTMKFDLGGPTLISNTSYYDREGSNVTDASTFDASLFGLVTPTGPAVSGVADWDSYDVIHNRQRSFAQEIRIQSAQNQRLRWVAGAYYDDNDQYNLEEFHAPSLPLLVQNEFGATMLDVFGQELLAPDIGFFGELGSSNSQVAGFGEANFDLTQSVTLTAGIRKSRLKYRFEGLNDGPYNGGQSASSGATSDSPWTPKIGIDFKPTDETMFYATAAKGFRTGGANVPIAAGRCDADLAALGLSAPPQTYDSDAVWSYELGAKSKLFDHRLQLSASVFSVDWTDIQQRVFLPTCGFYIVSNLGEARNQGFDLQMQGLVTDWLTLGLNVGYNDASFSRTVALESSNLVTDGDSLPIAPWSGTVSGDLDFDVAGLPAYVHAEYIISSSYPSMLVPRNPANSSFDPDYYRRPSTRLASVRAGVQVGDFDVSLFANNLFNADTTVGRANDNIGSPLFIINNLQPRVFGITVTYRSE